MPLFHAMLISLKATPCQKHALGRSFMLIVMR